MGTHMNRSACLLFIFATCTIKATEEQRVPQRSPQLKFKVVKDDGVSCLQITTHSRAMEVIIPPTMQDKADRIVSATELPDKQKAGRVLCYATSEGHVVISGSEGEGTGSYAFQCIPRQKGASKLEQIFWKPDTRYKWMLHALFNYEGIMPPEEIPLGSVDTILTWFSSEGSETEAKEGGALSQAHGDLVVSRESYSNELHIRATNTGISRKIRYAPFSPLTHITKNFCFTEDYLGHGNLWSIQKPQTLSSDSEQVNQHVNIASIDHLRDLVKQSERSAQLPFKIIEEEDDVEVLEITGDDDCVVTCPISEAVRKEKRYLEGEEIVSATEFPHENIVCYATKRGYVTFCRKKGQDYTFRCLPEPQAEVRGRSQLEGEAKDTFALQKIYCQKNNDGKWTLRALFNYKGKKPDEDIPLASLQMASTLLSGKYMEAEAKEKFELYKDAGSQYQAKSPKGDLVVSLGGWGELRIDEPHTGRFYKAVYVPSPTCTHVMKAFCFIGENPKEAALWALMTPNISSATKRHCRIAKLTTLEHLVLSPDENPLYQKPPSSEEAQIAAQINKALPFPTAISGLIASYLSFIEAEWVETRGYSGSDIILLGTDGNTPVVSSIPREEFIARLTKGEHLSRHRIFDSPEIYLGLVKLLKSTPAAGNDTLTLQKDPSGCNDITTFIERLKAAKEDDEDPNGIEITYTTRSKKPSDENGVILASQLTLEGFIACLRKYDPTLQWLAPADFNQNHFLRKFLMRFKPHRGTPKAHKFEIVGSTAGDYGNY